MSSSDPESPRGTDHVLRAMTDDGAFRVVVARTTDSSQAALETQKSFSTTGQVLEKSVGLKRTLIAVKDAFYAARAEGRAVGIGCGLKNSGIGNGAAEWGKARLVVEDDGTVSLYNGYTEMGQGLLTVLVQCAVEVTGLPAFRFVPKVDSTFDLQCGQTTGSRGTLFGGLAVAAAEGVEDAAVEHHRGPAPLVADGAVERFGQVEAARRPVVALQPAGGGGHQHAGPPPGADGRTVAKRRV